eukprot:ANDGO_03061.mRNA.1 Hsp70-Hsp90 organizing protein
MSDAVTLKDKGNAAFSAGNFEEAITYFSKAIEADPSNHVLYSNRSACYSSLKDFEKALDDAEHVVKIKPDWARGYSRKGAALHGLGRLLEAADVYEEGLAIDPGNKQMSDALREIESGLRAEGGAAGAPGGAADGKDPFASMGNVFNAGLIDKLRSDPQGRALLLQPDFEAKLRMIIANPKSLSAHMGDQRILQALMIGMGINAQFGNAGDFTGKGDGDVPMRDASNAESEYRSKEQPQSAKPSKPAEPELSPEEKEKKDRLTKAEALKEEGNALYKQKKFEEALKRYDDALEVMPENVAYMNNKAAVYMEQGDFDKCIKECEDAIEKGRAVRADFTVIAKIFARIGNAYAKQGKYDEAIQAYNKSLFEHRTSEVVNKLHQIEKTKKEADIKAYLNPEIAQQEKDRGNQLFKDGKWDEAIAAYSEAIKRNPEDATFYSNRSATYLKIAQFHPALQDADKCVALNPSFAKGWLRKGNAHFGLKEYHKALDAFDRGMHLDPNMSELKEGSERVLLALRRESSSGQVDEERAQRSLSDPEIQAILRDPQINIALQNMSENPRLAAEYMRDPVMSAKINKLIAAGVLRTGPAKPE